MDFFSFSNSFWVTLAPILAAQVYFAVTMAVFFYFRKKRNWQPPSYILDGRSTSKFLNVTLKHWWFWQILPVSKLFIKLRVTPNMLTMVGFLLNCVAALFLAKGLFGYGGWFVAFGASFDVFDGYVAMLTNQKTRSGGFFDSVVDRFSEGVVFLGLAYYFHNSWVLGFIIAALVGSMLVSYTRARAEVLGVDVRKVGSMQRAERVVYICVSAIFEPLTTSISHFWWENPYPVFVVGAICLIGVMSNGTAIYRMLHVMNVLDREDKKGVETIPQMLQQLTTKEGREQFWKNRKQSA